MTHPRFFGYGSLVNTATHDYPGTQPAWLSGWRRVWRHTSLRDVAYLSIEPSPGNRIAGLVADVPEGDWAALDVRETGYDRRSVPADALAVNGAHSDDVQVYSTRTDCNLPAGQHHPIHLSYLDVVVQGFFQVFGEDGVAHFFETTSGWEAPILNDRHEPRYPRHRQLSPSETALVDQNLARLSAHVQEIHQTRLP